MAMARRARRVDVCMDNSCVVRDGTAAVVLPCPGYVGGASTVRDPPRTSRHRERRHAPGRVETVSRSGGEPVRRSRFLRCTHGRHRLGIAVPRREDRPDWRYLLGRVEATFRAGSFERAARFTLDVAEAAERAGHHPDVDIRYPDRVHVALTTHAAGGQVTDADVELAARSPRSPQAAGVTSEPSVAQACEVAIDALDIDAVRPFWQAVLGYVAEPPHASTGQVVAIVDPARIGPAVWFQQMDAPAPAAQPHPPRRHRAPRRRRAARRRRPRRRRHAGQRRAGPGVLGAGRPRGQRSLRLHVAGPRLTWPVSSCRGRSC